MPHAIKISQITYIRTLAVVADILVNSDQRQANINLNVTSYFIYFFFSFSLAFLLHVSPMFRRVI